ncbi:16S rRNA (cytosine(1402)-N(4))-methyltransferase RsmH [Peptococcus simiae]|uniref:16S rRNA (cytosine(1402)-N(4))-methyltransferase RsmH n=1 Tax=Peptococcus simiae TaxID=1643805 RepID=UPI003980FCF2
MFQHIPVLAEEVLTHLAVKPGGVYADGTLGGGGHAGLILEASAPDGQIIATDRDELALAAARAHLAPYGDRVKAYHANYTELADFVAQDYPEGIDGILLDIGVSSPQIDTPDRGFSYMHDAPLDMRMDRSQGPSARDVVNELSEQALHDLIKDYGEEKWAARIAALICERRALAPIETTFQLVDVIERAIPKGAREKDSHVAKRTFQALRIATNDELGALEKAIDRLVDVLQVGGRLAIISFHSLEDRIVKNKFKYLAASCLCPPKWPVCTCGKVASVRIITRKPITAGSLELDHNRRAASAKLRVVEKII